MIHHRPVDARTERAAIGVARIEHRVVPGWFTSDDATGARRCATGQHTAGILDKRVRVDTSGEVATLTVKIKDLGGPDQQIRWR